MFMEIKEFAQKVQKAIAEILGDEYEVKLQEIQKNNGVLLQGLVMLKRGRNISPTIYLKPFWEAYEGGVTFSEIIRRLLQIYREDTPGKNIDMSFFEKFEKVKERICYRIINAEQNQNLLERIPHIPFLDLAICFYYAYEGKELGKGSILIYDTHVAMWNTNVEELLHYARSNTPELFPWECSSMDEVVRDFVEEPAILEELPMHIVSNQPRMYGAACMLYPGLLTSLAAKFNADFYIIPSSVHEIILLKDSGSENPEQLKEMISEVNKTQVEPEEVLSDSLYYFDRKENKVKII